MTKEQLLPRQRSFIWCLVVHNLSATQAAMRAGYSPKERCAAVIGCRLIHNYWHIREAIRRLASEMHKAEYSTADQALQALRLRRACAAAVPTQEAVMLT